LTQQTTGTIIVVTCFDFVRSSSGYHAVTLKKKDITFCFKQVYVFMFCKMHWKVTDSMQCNRSRRMRVITKDSLPQETAFLIQANLSLMRDLTYWPTWMD